MNLNIENWKEFLLSDYFDIVAGKYHYPNEYDIGDTPYISASSENNGVAQKSIWLQIFMATVSLPEKSDVQHFINQMTFVPQVMLMFFIQGLD